MVLATTKELVIESGIDALSLGSLFALYALGIALVFGIMGLINFAHGELVMVGGFVLAVLKPDLSLFPLLLVLVAIVVAFALGMERVAFRPIRGAAPATLLVTSFAVSFLLQNLAILIFGSTPRTLSVTETLGESFSIGEIAIPKLDVAVVATTVGFLLALTLFLTRTALGVQMRAAAEDFQMARLLGVAANRVIAAAFAISGLAAAAAALFLVSQTGTVTPEMGVTVVLFAFMATILGGLGSLVGAVAGGLLLGILTVVLQQSLPYELRPYRDAFVFGIVFALLIVRPRGLIPSRNTSRI
jgi:branched-chain amino acid transport system permease protein